MADIIYRSDAGSEVRVSGARHGIITIDFDFFEEEACIEAEPGFHDDPKEPGILATCECCDPQWIPLKVDVLDSLAS